MAPARDQSEQHGATSTQGTRTVLTVVKLLVIYPQSLSPRGVIILGHIATLALGATV